MATPKKTFAPGACAAVHSDYLPPDIHIQE
ncbi:hypothetical protein SAMN05444352_11023 [Pseudomonas japonica]|uniref:Uncharacterized protein n=1 Tax=Pseudomonas japonica TaxID=256466 RepID=A0A239FDV8_9PSED|nr:hypothetical protein SAMN05444352_11023 [Pseudomonas japonica]